MSIATQLTTLNTIKQNIKTAIEGKGQTVGSIPFGDYPAKITAISGGNNPIPFTRPSNWRVLPTITAGDQRVVGLVEISGIANAQNHVSFICNGAYTVDWGDGVVENFASGATANHLYDYATIDAGYVVSTDRKQCIISITPQAGQNLTVFNTQVRPTGITAGSPSTLWVELVMSLPNITTLSLGNATTVYHTILQSVTFQQLKDGLSVQQMCDNLFAMEYCYFPPTFICGANASYVFRNCNSLKSAPPFLTTNVTNSTGMFQSCYSLQYVPLYDFSKVTNGASIMFSECRSLQAIPEFNFGLCTDMNNMFASCESLRTIPVINTASATNMSQMFFNCHSLETVPLLNTSNVTNMGNIFGFCYALTSVAELDFSKVTTVIAGYDGMFINCFALERAPESLKNLPVGLTTPQSIFRGCKSLKYVPTFVNTAQWTQIHVSIYNVSIFDNCQALRELPPLNFSGVTSLPSNNIIGNPFSLERSQVYGLKFTHSYGNSKLGKPALLEVFNNLGTAAAQTLTITNAFGALQFPAISRSSTTTTGSNVVAITNTASFVVGMVVTGTGISGARTATADVATDTITAAAHGLANDKPISFSALGTVTGVSTYTRYYVVNATADTFQVALTAGGVPINLTGTNASVSYLVGALITAINPNVSVTLDIPATASATNTLVYRDLDTSIAVLKGWTVTG